MNKLERPSLAFWIGTGLFSMTFFVFHRTLSNDFVRWDDYFYIIQNPNIQGLDWAHLKNLFAIFPRGTYIPLSHLSMAMDYAIWGLMPAGFHLTSLVIHSVNAVLVFLLARKLIAAASSQPSAANGQRPWSIELGAILAALLFSIHPLRVESVAWATERRDVLSGFFALLSTLAYLRYVDSLNRPSGCRLGFLYTTLLFICALLCKAIVVTLPVVFLLLDAGVLRRFDLTHLREEQRKVLKALTEKVPWLAISFLVGAGTVHALYCGDWGDLPLNFQQYGFGSRLFQSFAGNAHYLIKMLIPVHLNPLYPFCTFNFTHPLVFLGMLLTVIPSVAVLIWRRSHPALATAWFSYLFIIAPMLGIAQNGPQFAADRYTYLACVPLCILAGGLCHRLWQPWERTKRTLVVWQWGVSLLLIGLLAWLSRLTWKQIPVWQNSETLWRHSASLAPENYPAWANLGFALAEQGRHGEALTAYRRALQLAPDSGVAWYNAGRSLDQMNRWTAAADAYRRVLDLDPTRADAHNNLGRVLLILNDPSSALRHLQTAYKLDPSPLAAFNLGCCHEALGNRPAAIRHLESAAHAGLPEAWIEWSGICERQGNRSAALAVLRKGAQQNANVRVQVAYVEMVLNQPQPQENDLALVRHLLDELKRTTAGRSEKVHRLAERFKSLGRPRP